MGIDVVSYSLTHESENFRPVCSWLFNILGNNHKSLGSLKVLCDLFLLDIHSFDNLQYNKFVYLSKYDSDAINNVIINFNKITNLLGSNKLNLNALEFFIYLSSFLVLDDFLDVFDTFSLSDCNYKFALDIINDFNLAKIKSIKIFLKNNGINTFFDIGAVRFLSLLKHIYTIEKSTLFLGIMYSKDNVQNNDYGCESYSFPGESILYNDFVVFNPLNFDYIGVYKKYGKFYSFGAVMGDSGPIISRNALKILFSYLPVGSKIINKGRHFSKGSLSGDSLPLILHLFKKQELLNIDVSLKPGSNWLNFKGKKSKLSKLIIEKMGGTEVVNKIDSKTSNNSNILFETKNYSDALEIVDLINDLILKYTGDQKFYACVEKFCGDDLVWRIKIPSFVITKKS